MNGLIVVGAGILGGAIGGFVGTIAMMAWADMDGPGVLTWVPGGVAIGAVVGVYAGVELLG